MTTVMQNYSFVAESTSFNPVIDKINALAKKNKSNKSAVIREILSEHFGIKVESKSNNFSRNIR